MTLLSHEARMAVCRESGPSAMAVLDVLVHGCQGDGIAITHRDIADQTGLGQSTIKRALSQLATAEWIEIEAQHAIGHRLANRYVITAPTNHATRGPHTQKGHEAQNEPPAQNELALSNLSNINCINNTFDNYTTNHIDKEIIQKAGQGPAGTLDTMERPKHSLLDEPLSPWPPPGSPMPTGDPNTNTWAFLGQSAWLVSFFEQLVLDKNRRESLTKGRKPLDSIPEKRRYAWYVCALKLIRKAPLEQICTVISWAFMTGDGYMPFAVDGYMDYHRDRDSKITHIRIINENWDQLVKAWQEAGSPTTEQLAQIQVTPRRQAQESSATRGAKNQKKCTEDQINELVELFAQIQSKLADEFHRNNWGTTFRIMMDHDKVPFADLKEVITLLPKAAEFVDIAKYTSAFNIRHDWEFLKDAVPDFAAAIEFARSTHQTPMRHPDTIDDKHAATEKTPSTKTMRDSIYSDDLSSKASGVFPVNESSVF